MNGSWPGVLRRRMSGRAGGIDGGVRKLFRHAPALFRSRFPSRPPCNLFVDITTHLLHILPVRSAEFKKWLAQQGCTFKRGKGGHLKVYLNGRRSVLPLHSAELKKGTVEGIKKQLGLK